MQNIEIHLPSGANDWEVEQALEASLAEIGLEVSLHGTLKKFPGCRHWHVKSVGKSGTLELTFWPQEQRVWLTIQSGRAAEWITAALPEVQRVLERGLTALPRG
jgi:hypothetical protein